MIEAGRAVRMRRICRLVQDQQLVVADTKSGAAAAPGQLRQPNLLRVEDQRSVEVGDRQMDDANMRLRMDWHLGQRRRLYVSDMPSPEGDTIDVQASGRVVMA